MKKRKVVFTDICYICGKKIIGYESTFNETWFTNFKGLSAHARCLKHGSWRRGEDHYEIG